MENILWALTGGFSIIFGLLVLIWRHIGKVEDKIIKIEDRITNVEHNLIEIKTIIRMKEFYSGQDDRHMKKAE